MKFWQRVWPEIRALAAPIISFWAALVLSHGLFTLLVLLFENNGNRDPKDIGVFLVIWCILLVGTSSGQLLALMRFRPTLLFGTTFIFWSITFFAWIMGNEYGFIQNRDVYQIVVVGLFLAPFYFVCGFWSLTTHREIWAVFTPLIGFVGCIIFISENNGDQTEWFNGQKWAIWSGVTISVLCVGVILLLMFWMFRELHRLHRWRTSPQGPDFGISATRKGFSASSGRTGWRGLFALGIFAVFLTAASAVVAPYLWRSSPSDEENPSEYSNAPSPDESEEFKQPNPEVTEPELPPSDGLEQMVEAGQQALSILLNLLFLLILVLLGLLVFGQPLRRALLLQYLRRPFWPVSPTRRIAQHWRLVEVALGDIGIHRQPGDSAISLSHRANSKIHLIDPEALARAAEIADRVQHGIGVDPGDVMWARRAAEMTFQTIWDELSEWQKFRAMYRWL